MIQSTRTARLLALSAALSVLPQVLVAAPGKVSPDWWYSHTLVTSPPTHFRGPFQCDSMTFFIVHHGGPLAIEFKVDRPSTELRNNHGIRFPHAVFWQLYDAEEMLVTQEYHKFTSDVQKQRLFEMELANAPAGIYQFRYAKSPGNDMTVDLRTEPATSFGIMPCRAPLLSGTKGQFDQVFLYVPPGHDQLALRTYASEVDVLDLAGNPVGSSDAKPELAVKPDTVYRLQLQHKFHWPASAFAITGVPPILCPDEQTARNIRGSVEVAPDGRLLAHKWQLRMWRWMHSLKPEDLAVEVADLLPLRDLWLKDPRNAGLLGITGPFNHLPRILRDQDLDPQSPTYGQGINCAWSGPSM